MERRDPDVRYEYIAGMVYKRHGETVAHGRIMLNIASALDQHLTWPCMAFCGGVQVLIGRKKNGKRHYVYPDAVVSCSPEDSRPTNMLVESPKIVFEVLSPGTEYKDRGVKLRAYQSCPTMKEIVFVNQFAPHVEVWQRDKENIAHWNKRFYDRGEKVHLASLDIHVTIEDLYQRLPALLEEDVEDEE